MIPFQHWTVFVCKIPLCLDFLFIVEEDKYCFLVFFDSWTNHIFPKVRLTTFVILGLKVGFNGYFDLGVSQLIGLKLWVNFNGLSDFPSFLMLLIQIRFESSCIHRLFCCNLEDRGLFVFESGFLGLKNCLRVVLFSFEGWSLFFYLYSFAKKLVWKRGDSFLLFRDDWEITSIFIDFCFRYQ